MPQAKVKMMLPATMLRPAWEIVAQRSDVETIPFDMTLPTADLHRLLADVDYLGVSLTPIRQAEIDAAPKLRAVARHGVGFDSVDVAALTRRGVPLFTTGTANSPSVAENALFCMLEFAKRGRAFDAMVRERRWQDRMREALPVDLLGKYLLVLGFGRIGTRLCKMTTAIGMRVHVFDPYVAADTITAAGCAAVTDLNTALAQADFISIHCPKNAETTNLFDAARLARLKPSAYLINTARGGIVNEAALHAALTQGQLAGAALDVFEIEPVEPANALLALKQVIVAPHMAGVTRESMERMGIAVVENLLNMLDGRPNIDNAVNKEVLGAR
jgi:D-3-phosphoglycerate dehydrogenase